MVLQQRLFELLRQAPEAAPMVGYGATAMGNQKLERGEIFEQVAGQALHEGGGVSIEVMRAGGVKAAVATGAHVDHGRNVVLDHLFVDGVPSPVAQGR